MSYHGGCLCGDVKIQLDEEPVLQALCHCTDCQQESGGFGFPDVVFKPDAVKVVKGEPKLYDDVKPSGNHVRHYFCPRCGSTLWSSLDALGKVNAVKLGTFSLGSGTAFFHPSDELFCKSKQQWVKDISIQGTNQHDGMPPA